MISETRGWGEGRCYESGVSFVFFLRVKSASISSERSPFARPVRNRFSTPAEFGAGRDRGTRLAGDSHMSSLG